MTSWIKKEADSTDKYEKDLESIKKGLGFWALTGEVVVIGVLDYEQNKGAVYFQAPGENFEKTEESRWLPNNSQKALSWNLSLTHMHSISAAAKKF